MRSDVVRNSIIGLLHLLKAGISTLLNLENANVMTIPASMLAWMIDG